MSAIRAVKLPERTATTTGKLPADLLHLFWNADTDKLDLHGDASYIAGRLLTSPDIRAWNWALNNLPHSEVRVALTKRGINERTRALGTNWTRHG